uniref:Uncharacterized protein n=1 Tax=Rhizophora mucronata TaxID=61149 RepID=A0A2P2J2L4_RHIMU
MLLCCWISNIMPE